MALNLRHQTGAQFAARLRQRFREAQGDDAARIARWIVRRIAMGDLTDAQVRNAFGLTSGQWTTLKTKLVALSDSYVAVRAAKGE